MFDHEVYAIAFVASNDSDKVEKYLEFKEVVSLFEKHPQFVDALLFNRELFNDFREDFEATLSPVVYNFLDIVIEDGLIDQIFKIETAIRNHLVELEEYNYCVFESADKLSVSFDERLTNMILQKTEGKVEIVKKVNPKLKSGVRMILNNKSIDLSMSGRLERLLSEVS